MPRRPPLELRAGVGRRVLLVGPYAVKVPSLHNGWLYFIYGLLGNLLEALRWEATRHPQLAPVLHRGPLGLWLVMRRYPHVLTRRLTAEELATLPFLEVDNNGENIAWDGQRFVLLDYGNTAWLLDVKERPDG